MHTWTRYIPNDRNPSVRTVHKIFSQIWNCLSIVYRNPWMLVSDRHCWNNSFVDFLISMFPVSLVGKDCLIELCTYLHCYKKLQIFIKKVHASILCILGCIFVYLFIYLLLLCRPSIRSLVHIWGRPRGRNIRRYWTGKNWITTAKGPFIYYVGGREV